MTEQFIQNAEELKQAFGIDEATEYTNFIPFAKEKFGFSVQRNYPDDVQFKPPTLKDGKTPDTVVLIRVLYKHPDQFDESISPEKVPIFMDIGPHSQYLYRRFDYDFTKDDCPTEESVLRSKKTPTYQAAIAR